MKDTSTKATHNRETLRMMMAEEKIWCLPVPSAAKAIQLLDTIKTDPSARR